MTTTPMSGAGVSRYLRLYRVLSQALAEGRFDTGALLPSEPRLMRDYGVSRSTVRRALERLEAEGRIDRKRGSGTFAREQRTEASAARDLSPVLDAAAGATSRILAFQHIPTPAFLLGERSGFGAATLLIRQLRYVGREPTVFETAYLPEDIASGLTRRQLDAGRGIILTVLETLGHRSASLEREFIALEAEPLAANGLGLAIGAPVFNVRTLARDPKRRTLAYISSLYRPDRYEAHLTVSIGGPRRHRGRKRDRET